MKCIGALTTLLCLLLIASILLFKPKKEHFTEAVTNNKNTPHIVFWDKHLTYQFILQDADDYFQNMSDVQLQQRMNVADQLASNVRNSYKERCARAAVSFAEEEKVALRGAAHQVDSLLEKRGVSKDKLSQVPWMFALTEGNTYEDGLPHVRGIDRNVYMLSTNTTLQETHDMCQLSMTLLYLRMSTLFPNRVLKGTRGIHMGDTAFPKSWGLPSCGGPA